MRILQKINIPFKKHKSIIYSLLFSSFIPEIQRVFLRFFEESRLQFLFTHNIPMIPISLRQHQTQPQQSQVNNNPLFRLLKRFCFNNNSKYFSKIPRFYNTIHSSYYAYNADFEFALVRINRSAVETFINAVQQFRIIYNNPEYYINPLRRNVIHNAVKDMDEESLQILLGYQMTRLFPYN